MPSPFPPVVLKAFLDQRDEMIASSQAKVREVLPNMTDAQRAWSDEHSCQYQDLFTSYLREGSIEAILPRMREITRDTTQTGISLDAFVRIIFDSFARSKAMLVKLMPCEGDELVQVFTRLDAYEHALFDEFSRAQREYWERREREAEKLQTDFFNHLPFPAITGTRDLIIRAVNPALIECIPVHPDQIIGLSVEQWLLRMSLPRSDVRRLMSKFEKQGTLLQEEVEIRGPSGSPSMVLMLSLNYVTDLEGHTSGFQAMIEDMTEKRALQRRVAAQKAQMDAIFNSTPAGLIFVDSDRIVQRINESACKLLGYPPPKEVEKTDMHSFREKVKGNFKYPERFVQLLDEVYSSSESSRTGTFENVKPERMVRYSVTPVYDDDNDPIGWLWIFNDITEQLKSEKLRNDLVHMIVHDLKNPLTSIRGGVYLLRDTTSDSGGKTDQALDLVQRNCDRMMSMIMNLLDIERLETGKLQLVRSNIPIAEFMRTALDGQGLAAGTRELKLEIAPELESVKICADANLLDRVMANLVSNAIKHTRHNGHIMVRVCEGPEGCVSVAVADDGAGIPKEYHEKIFQKFGQAELRSEGHKTDTGLGLTFCKLTVEAHGGHISVESDAGKGATFTFTLPRTAECDDNGGAVVAQTSAVTAM